MSISETIVSVLARTLLADCPIRIRKGPVRGLRWTVAPATGYWRGKVESEVEETILSLTLPFNPVCWDLGAHFGYFSFVMARVFGSGAKVFAFEPDPYSFQKASKHLSLNPEFDITFLNIAVDESEREMAFIRDRNYSFASHLPYVGEVVPDSAMKIKTQSLDALVEKGTIELPHFIKIDIEGHGAPALRGAQHSLERAKPTIVMSFHSPREVDGSVAILKELGYRAINITNDMPTPDFNGTALFQV